MTKWINVTESINDTDWLINLDLVAAIHPPSCTLELNGELFHITRESMDKVLESEPF